MCMFFKFSDAYITTDRNLSMAQVRSNKYIISIDLETFKYINLKNDIQIFTITVFDKSVEWKGQIWSKLPVLYSLNFVD